VYCFLLQVKERPIKRRIGTLWKVVDLLHYLKSTADGGRAGGHVSYFDIEENRVLSASFTRQIFRCIVLELRVRVHLILIVP